MEEVTDEPLYRDRVCGIDMARLRWWRRSGCHQIATRRGRRARPELRDHEAGGAGAGGLAAQLAGARGGDGGNPDYWKGPFSRLEAEGSGCVLADAKQVKNLPGRPKRDPSDSRWLAACFERGAVAACSVATPEFRVIRLHTRYRRDLTEERTREKQRDGEAAGAPRGAVVSDGGERPPSLCRRSSGVKLGQPEPGTVVRVGAASTKTGRFSTAGWAGSGERDGKVYERNRLVTPRIWPAQIRWIGLVGCAPASHDGRGTPGRIFASGSGGHGELSAA